MTNTIQFMWSVQNPINRNCQKSEFVFLVHDLNLFYSANSFMQDMSSLNCNYQLNYTPKSALDTKAILKSFTNCCFYSNSRSCRWSRIKYFNSITYKNNDDSKGALQHWNIWSSVLNGPRKFSMNMNSCLETTYQQAKEGFFLVYSAFLWVPLGILALQKSRTSLHSTVVPDRVLLPCSGVFNTMTRFTRKLELQVISLSCHAWIIGKVSW